SVINHPSRDGHPFGGWRLPGHAAFGHPGEWAILAVAKRSAVQRGITGHQGFDAVEVVGVYCMLKLPDLFERLNMRFKLGPTGKAVQTRNLELSFGNRAGIADLEQVFGLQLEMAEIGTVRKRTWDF